MADTIYALDLVRFASATVGVGAYSQGATPSGYLTPQLAGAVSGRRYILRVESGTTWELVESVASAGSPWTWSRARVIRNSSGGTSAVNWLAGQTQTITIVSAADRSVVLDTDGLIPQALLPQRPASLLAHGATQSVPTGTATTLGFNVLETNTLGAASGGPPTWNGFVVPTGGLFDIRGRALFAAGSGGTARRLALVVNNSFALAEAFLPPVAGSTIPLAVSAVAGLAAGTTLTLQVAQDSGAALNVGGAPTTHFEVVRL